MEDEFLVYEPCHNNQATHQYVNYSNLTPTLDPHTREKFQNLLTGLRHSGEVVKYLVSQGADVFQNLLTGLRHSGEISFLSKPPFWLFQNLLTGLRHSG